MFHTTLALLKSRGACANRYKVLVKGLGGVRAWGEDTPIPLARALDSNGLEDILWALQAVLPHEEERRDRFARLLACDYAEHALHFYEERQPDDKRPRTAIEVSRAFVDGNATIEELCAAAGVWSAGDAARDARAAAWDSGDAELEWQTQRLRVMLAIA